MLQLSEWTGTDWKILIGSGDPPASGFISGITEPYYQVNANLDGPRNIGCRPATFTTYGGAIVNGVAQLAIEGSYFENVIFPCVIDIRANMRFKNCMVIIPKSYTNPDSLHACVRILNGGSLTLVEFEYLEIHNLAQRPMNGIMGRNFEATNFVIAGCVDGLVDSTAGSAPQVFGYHVKDFIVPDTAWFYSSPASSDIHTSDTQSHGEPLQLSSTLTKTAENFVALGYVSEYIGTGTPGSGSDAGNGYVPASGNNYIKTQAVQEASRAALCSWMTTPSQSKYGIAHRLPSSGGSLAGIMVNRPNFTAKKGYLGGGIKTVNALDAYFAAGVIACSFEDMTVWNDMKHGHGDDSATSTSDPDLNFALKGHAFAVRPSRSFALLTGQWFDGTELTASIIPA